jgi:GH18 family chitinase
MINLKKYSSILILIQKVYFIICLNSNDIDSSNRLNDLNTEKEIKDQVLQRRVCYFANWAPYRSLKPALYPDNIDPELCTHIHYAFAKIDPITLSLLPTEEHDMNWTDNTNMPLYIRLYSLKRRNLSLKILLAVGGLFS